MSAVCPKCGSSRISFDGKDEFCCLNCSRIWYAAPPEPTVIDQPSPDRRSIKDRYAGNHEWIVSPEVMALSHRKHRLRNCDICGRRVLKATLFGSLCTRCMSRLHSWQKNKSHLTGPPFLRDGKRWRPSPLRMYQADLVTETSAEGLLDALKRVLNHLEQPYNPQDIDVANRHPQSKYERDEVTQ